MNATTWEIGKQIEKIMERGERAAELELIDRWVARTDFWIDDWTPEWKKEWKGVKIQ